MIGIGVVSFIILLAIESGAVKCIKCMPTIYPCFGPEAIDEDDDDSDDDDSNDDDDVRTEKCRIAKMSLNELKSETMPLVMKNVSKLYGTFCAVNKFSVSIKR